MRGLAIGLLVTAAALTPSGLAEAQDEVAEETASDVHHVVPPPRPTDQGRELLLDIHGAAVVPVYVGGLCPSGHECVMNAGVGIGVTVEQRWRDRVGLLVSYDAWVVDSDSLFEVGLMHSFRLGLRYVLDDATNVHPFLEARLAFLAFGDTSTVQATGGGISAGGGAEIEVSDAIAAIVDAELWTFATADFETRDGLRRSNGFGANLAVQISVGLEILLGVL